jgi:spore maturation protein CgeB
MNCPVCNEQNYSLWGMVGPYEILTCKGCGLGITSPFPSTAVLAETNQEIYQVEQRIQAYLSRQYYFENRYKQYVKNIKTFKQKGRLLDVGCNIGLFLKVSRQEGFDVLGVELNKDCAEYGRKHYDLDIRSNYLDEVAFPDEYFDVITLFDVLEHVPDMHGFIAEVRRILKADGMLVLQLPNLNSVMAGITKSNWNWLTPPDHLYHFTPYTINKFLYLKGFSPKRTRSWEPADEFANNVLSSFKAKNLLGRIIFKVNQVTKLFTLLVVLVQKFWWQAGKGGLLEIYAIKADRER